MPLWERTVNQYKRTQENELEGTWINENYKLNLFRSGEQMVAFIAEPPKERDVWYKGQLKFMYGVDSGAGIYLMGDKTPMPAKFNVNKFGHLEVTLVTAKESFSFARQ